jgi:hypothetical protein
MKMFANTKHLPYLCRITINKHYFQNKNLGLSKMLLKNSCDLAHFYKLLTTQPLQSDNSITLGADSKSYMPAHIRIEHVLNNEQGVVMSVAHFSYAGGDLVPDPEVYFWYNPKIGLAAAIGVNQILGSCQYFVVKNGKMGINNIRCAEIRLFGDQFLANINYQQDLDIFGCIDADQLEEMENEY